MVRKALLVLVAAYVSAVSIWAQAPITVCDSGCTYLPSQLQTALNAATASGATVLLQQNKEFIGSYTVPRHGNAAYATLKTGVTSTGQLVSASVFPAAGIRVTEAMATAAGYATIRATANNESALRTANPSGGTAPGYWRLEHLTFGSNVSTDYTGSGDMFRCGSDDNATVTSRSLIAGNFVVSQVFFKGDPTTGQFRAIGAHCNNFTIQDSLFKNIKALGSDNQAIYCNSFETGLLITNSRFEAAGAEPIMCGGGAGAARPSATVVSASSNTAATLSEFTGLRVGMAFSINVGGLEEQTKVVTCGAGLAQRDLCTQAAITFEAVSGTPDVPGDVDWGLNPSMTLTYSHIEQPLSMRGAILGTPQGVQVTAIASGGSGCAVGTVPAGTHAYRVVGRLKVAGNSVNNYATSGASVEVQITTNSPGCLKVQWTDLPNEGEYRVYGRSAGGQTMYWTVVAGTTTYTDTGSTGTTGSVPTGTGSVWRLKNLLELKNCVNCTIRYNVFDNLWNISGVGQGAYAILLTPANSGNDTTQVADVDFSYNKVRHAAGGVQLTGRHATSTAGAGEGVGRTERISVRHNDFLDIDGSAYGASTSRGLLVSTKYDAVYVAGQALGPKDVTWEHNFFDNDNNALVWLNIGGVGTIENFTYRNNVGRKGGYGVTGNNSCTQGTGCFTAQTSGTSVLTPNLIADASCSSYPSGWLCPTSTALNNEFVSFSGANYTFKPGSPYLTAGAGGTYLGPDRTTLEAGTAIALSGDRTGSIGGDPPVDPPTLPPSITTATIDGGVEGAPYSQNIDAVCPKAPCAFGGSGLMTGVTLTGVSSTRATLVGTLTTRGSFTPTITITDADGRATPITYDVTVTAAPPTGEPQEPAPTRPERYGMHERVHFGRPCVEPSAGDGDMYEPRKVKVGDLWSDPCVTPSLKFLMVTSPAVTWRKMAFWPSVTPSTITTAGAATYTAAELIGGLILRDPNGAARADVTPSAALLVAAIPSAAVGDVVDFDVRNTADAAETITVTAGAGVALSGPMTIAQGSAQRFRAVVGSVGTGTEAVTIYSLTPQVSSTAVPVSVMFRSDAGSAYAYDGTGTDEIDSSFRHRARKDLTNATEIRVMAQQGAAAATASLRLDYSTDNGGAWMSSTATVTMSTSANTFITGSWTAPPAGMKGDVLLRVVFTGGNTTETPSVHNVYAEVR